MDWNTVKEFIRPDLLILCVFLYSVGAFLRLLPVWENDWTVPYIQLGVSVIFTPIYMALVLDTGWSFKTIIIGIIQAVLLAALCVFSSQLVVQLKQRRSVAPKPNDQLKGE